MKKIGILALSIALGLSSISCATLDYTIQVMAEEVDNEVIDVENNEVEYNFTTTKEDFLNAEKDNHFFDGKENTDSLYNALKEKIIENARKENKKYKIEVKVELEKEPDIKKVLDQIVEDMECYLYWSNGKIEYDHDHHPGDDLCYIKFIFHSEDEPATQNGMYVDDNGNFIIPWQNIDKGSQPEKTEPDTPASDDPDTPGSDEPDTPVIPDESVEPEKHHFTLDELIEKAGDSLVLIMDDDGEHILFVAGHFFDQTYTNEEDMMAAIEEMKDLIGYKENRVYKVSNQTTDKYGNTYYRFAESINDSFYENYGQIIIATNEEGQIQCISAPSYVQIEDKEYEEFDTTALLEEGGVRTYLESFGWEIIADPEIDFNETMKQMCYVFKLKNENGLYGKFYYSLNTNEKGDAADIKQFGSYEEMMENGSSHQYLIDQDIQTTMMSFVDNFGNTVELPVAYEEGKGYYLLDKEYNMIGTITDLATWALIAPLEPLYFQDPSEVPSHFVSAFYNMLDSFKSYKEIGLYDGSKPVKLIFQPNNTAMNAAASFNGDSINIYLNNNEIISSYDVVSHEITHAFTQYISGNLAYVDCTGALMESYADVCGNILEMMAYEKGFIQNATVDLDQWLINESNKTIRNMSDPTEYNNSKEVFGEYYIINNKEGSIYEDYGGVHTNSGILNRIVYRMHTEANMPFEDLINIFFTTQHLFSNSSSYQTIQGYIGFMMKNLGYAQSVIDQVDQFFEEAGTNKYSETNTWDTIEPAQGFVKNAVKINGYRDYIPDSQTMIVVGVNRDTNKNAQLSRDETDVFGAISKEKIDFDRFVIMVVNNSTDESYQGDLRLNSEEDIGKPVDTLDLLSSAYSQSNSDNREMVVQTLVQGYSAGEITDLITQLVIQVPEEMQFYTLQITNKNEGTGNAGVFYEAPYLENEGCFDVLLRNDSTYDFVLYNSFDEEEKTYVLDHYTVPKEEAVDGEVKVNYQDIFTEKVEEVPEEEMSEASSEVAEETSEASLEVMEGIE